MADHRAFGNPSQDPCSSDGLLYPNSGTQAGRSLPALGWILASVATLVRDYQSYSFRAARPTLPIFAALTYGRHVSIDISAEANSSPGGSCSWLSQPQRRSAGDV